MTAQKTKHISDICVPFHLTSLMHDELKMVITGMDTPKYGETLRDT